MEGQVLEKAYDPKDFEDRIYQFWLENGLFKPAEGNGKPPYVITMPPPNVTGVLHMGHGLNNSLQDILVRYHRMMGRPTLWLPGTDHAGIATQHVVEKRLRKQGKTRHDIGRDAFIAETWKVKEEHHAIIVKQLRKLGASCDWSRERFTLDEGLSRAVREVFVTLYERGLVYKGNYLVNWCPSCGTALSDDEVEHQETAGRMYRYRYPFSDGSGSIVIATTRPETMLGDTAVAVHPDDERYRGAVGKKVDLPLTGRSIPVIADSYVDMEFGTGAVKITPAHDPNDYAMAERHNLDKVNILNPDGTLNGNVPKPYQGLPVLEARKKVVQDLKDAGVYIDDVEHVHQVGHCYRCNTAIEPFLSEQWFVRMRELAVKALGAWEQGRVRFFPKKWENTYAHWMRTIRDWCISRQLWWGHRIPVWYCDDCGEMMVLREDPAVCARCGSKRIRQDDFVLDTWFSSALWPFSTLGWPEKTKDLERFFPSSTLVTGYDIIFFWVARMIMTSEEFMGREPFRDVYITGLVRDIHGRKMSKSLGNGIDPLDIIETYGADALKFTLAFLAAQGQDIPVERDTFKLGSKFANKGWNAARFLLMNMEGAQIRPIGDIILTDIDRWIYHRLNETVLVVHRAMESYRFNEASSAMYEFFWNDFCDWYIEASKLSLYGTDRDEKERAVSLLCHLLDESLRLMHPFLSFVTEEIYQKLPGHGFALINAAYPAAKEGRNAPEAASRFESLKELITAVRTLRSEFAVSPERKVAVWVKIDPGFPHAEFFRSYTELADLLMGASGIVISQNRPDKAGAVPVPGSGFEAFVFIRDVIDVPKEIAKLRKEGEKLEKLISAQDAKLGNDSFLSKAPPEVIVKEKEKLAEFSERLSKIRSYLQELG